MRARDDGGTRRRGAGRRVRTRRLALALLASGCFTPITDPNRWDIGRGEMPRFGNDSDVCADQASHPLQPDHPAAGQIDPEDYRRCMESLGWRLRG